MGHGVIIPIVDDGVAHAGAAGFFALPMDIHEARKFLEVARLEGGEGLVAEVFGEVEIVEHRGVVALGFVVLVLEDGRRTAAVAGEKQEEIIFEVKQGLLGRHTGAVFDAAIFVKGEGGDATNGGDVLILFADGLAEFVELDIAGLFGELGGRNERALRSVEGFEEGGGKAAARAKAGAAGDVGHRGELKVRIADAGELEGFADDGMFDLVDGGDALEFRVLDNDLGLKRAVLRDVNVFVDRRGDEEAPVFAVVRRKVGAAAAEGNAKW